MRPEWWPMLVASVQRHEGCRLTPYRDTLGVLTIGWGRNLTERGITQAEADAMLATDLETAYREALAAWPWLRVLSDARQAVLVEMTYNLGLSRVRTFGKMLEAVMKGRYAEAAQEMLDSRWRTQVGARAVRLAEVMRRG